MCVVDQMSWSKQAVEDNTQAITNVINQYLHFKNSETAVLRGEANHDKLHHIRPLLTMLEERFVQEYWPNRENAIYKGMVKFMGRLHGLQAVYATNKPTKRGIKV